MTGLNNAYFANPNGWSVDETAVDNLTSTTVAAQKLNELRHTWNRS